MKTEEKYWKEAAELKGSGVSDKEVALEAIRACLKDRDKFAEEMLTKVNKINQELAKMNQTIDRINSLLAASFPGRTSYVGSLPGL